MRDYERFECAIMRLMKFVKAFSPEDAFWLGRNKIGGDPVNIRLTKLTNIKPYDKNPRKNDNAVDKVAASIKEFGFRQPIVVDRDNIIVAGHTRYKAAKKLKLSEVPCVMADDLTDEQIKAYRLADNKTAEFAEWDIDMLNYELGDIFNLDMIKFGFESFDNEKMEFEKVELKPYEKVHYLISFDLNLHDEVIQHIEKLRQIGGVEIESTLN